MSAEDLLLELRPQPWMADANCAGVDPELFFPQRGDPTAEAKAVCRACLIQAECLDYVLSINERHGIWGGTSERQRKAIRQRWTEGPRRTRRPVPQPGPRQDTTSAAGDPASAVA